jgi:hypothetical protein
LRLVLEGGRAWLRIGLPATADRRCLALGFVLETDGPARLAAWAEGDESGPPGPVEVALPAASTYAGVVEIDAHPSLAAAVRLDVESEADVRCSDLFVVSYG